MLQKMSILGVWIYCVLMSLPMQAKNRYSPFKEGSPDLEVTSIKITDVRGNKAYIDYVVTNVGKRAIEMNHMQYKLYASSVNTFNPATAASSGSGLFIDSSYIMVPGEQFRGSVTLVVPAQVSIQLMHYLYFTAAARDGYSAQESNLANNSLVTDSDLAKAELSLQVQLLYTRHDTLVVHYTLQNTGNRPLYLSSFLLQTFVSEDAVLTSADRQTYQNSFGTNVLYGGQYWSDNIYTATGADLSQTPYLLIKMGLAPGKTHPYLKNSSDTAVINVANYNPDITMRDFYADSVIGNRVDYHGLVYNKAGHAAGIDGYNLRIFLSSDSILSIEEDRMISTQIISTPDYYWFSSSFEAPLDLKAYPYLIAQVQRRPELPDNGDDLSNNQQYFYIPEVFADVQVTDFDVTYDESTLYYDYTISSENRSLHLNRFQYDLYLSQDETYDETDSLITTSIFNDAYIYGHTRYSDEGFLPIDLYALDYSYVIMKVSPVGIYYEVTDSNNVGYSYPIPLITEPWPGGGMSEFKISQTNDLVTVETKDKSKGNYMLYTLTGEKLSEGQFESQQQINASGFKNGIYLLKVSNDTSLETNRIMVQH